jgi:hypothetical protein
MNMMWNFYIDVQKKTEPNFDSSLVSIIGGVKEMRRNTQQIIKITAIKMKYMCKLQEKTQPRRCVILSDIYMSSSHDIYIKGI